MDHDHVKAHGLEPLYNILVVLNDNVHVPLGHFPYMSGTPGRWEHRRGDGVRLAQKRWVGAPAGVYQLYGELGAVRMYNFRQAGQIYHLVVIRDIQLTGKVLARVMINRSRANSHEPDACGGLHVQVVNVVVGHAAVMRCHGIDMGRKLQPVF